MPQAKKILKVAVISIVLLWILSIIPFSSKIEQEIPAAIYKNDAVAESKKQAGRICRHLSNGTMTHKIPS